METSVLSVDSLGESELELLRDKLRQKDHIINEKSQIIDSLRQQVKDLAEDNEEMDNNQQLMQQKVDRLTRELEERNQDLESLSHTLKEVETAHEKLERRMEARTGQVQKFAEDLVKAKKELEETRSLNEDLQHKNEKLSTELELARSKKRAFEDMKHEEELQQQQQLLKERHQPRQQEAEYKPQAQKFSSALRFPIADEIGEFMDSSSQLSALAGTPQACQYHRQKYIRAPGTITKNEPPARVKQERFDIEFESKPSVEENIVPPLVPIKQQERPAGRPQPIIMRNEPPVASLRKELTYEEEHALRVARAQELARRNAKTKPLHQTSYALELDTFDITNFNEHEIKRGNIRPPQRAPPQPPVSQLGHKQPGSTRRALANCSNTPPVVKRQVYKKAEAFIV